jgi:photosystem II stability/assembly factor-like uncharacterized protein
MTAAIPMRRQIRRWLPAALSVGVLAAVSLWFTASTPKSGVATAKGPSPVLERTDPISGRHSPTASGDTSKSAPLPDVPYVELALSIVNPNLLDVEVHPDGDLVFAVGTEGTLLRSDDDAKTFGHCATRTREYLTRVAVESGSGVVLVTGSGGTLLRSSDRGRTFESLEFEERGVLTDIAQSTRDNTLVIVGEGGTARVSRDGGESFVRENTGVSSALSEVVATSRSGRFIAAGDAGVVVVRHSTGQWKRVELPSSAFATALERLPDDTVIAAFGDGLVFRSEDEGDSFQVAHHGTPNDYVLAIDADADGGQLLLRARQRPALLSRDRARTFESLGEKWPASVTALRWVNGRGFWGTTATGGVVKSDLMVGKFVQASSGSAGRAHAIVQNPRTGTLIAVGASGFISRSRFDADEVEVVRPDLGGLIRAVAWDPRRDVVIGVGLDGTVVRSTDGGRSYGRVPIVLPPKAELSAVTFEPQSRAFVAATTTGALFRSLDGGRTFSPRVDLGAQVFELVPSGYGEVLALTDSGARSSNDGGSSFRSVMAQSRAPLRAARFVDEAVAVAVGDAGGIYRRATSQGPFSVVASSATATLRALALDGKKRRVFVVGDHGTLLVSEDQGEHFSSVTVPTEENLFVIAISDDGDWLYVGGNAGTLLRSGDGGRSFELVATGSRQPIRAIAFDPVAREFVVGGVGGLLMRTRGLRTPERVAGRFGGRFDNLLYHGPSRTMIVAGDRLMRISAQ